MKYTNKKYLFVTYGSKRIKGVQTKAINISKYLPKEEVLILNHGDSSWLVEAGLDVCNLDFNVFDSPLQITKFPEEILDSAKILIFCDFPSNMLFEYLVFWYFYQNTRIPICICDNIYSEDQFERSKTYGIYYQLSDMVLLSGLNLFQDYLTKYDKAFLLPPFFKKPEKDSTACRSDLIKELKIKNKDYKNIIYIAYNKKVLELSKKIIKRLKRLNCNHIITTTIPDADFSDIKNENFYLVNKQLSIDELILMMLAGDVVICKFGYQQFIESLSLGKPTITIADSGLKVSWLSKKLRSNFSFYPKINEKLLVEITRLVNNKKYYLKRIENIKSLHNNEYDGGEKASDYIKQLVSSKDLPERKRIPKKLLLTTNTKENFKKVKEIFQQENFIFPIVFSNRFLEREFGYEKGARPIINDMNAFNMNDKNDYLDSSVAFHLSLSSVAYHSLNPIFPFISDILNSLEKIISDSDTIYLVGKEAENLFSNLITRLDCKSKVKVY